MLSRRPTLGYTLAEMIVATALGGLVLAIISGIAARQQRVLGDLAEYAAVAQQVQDAHAILPSELSRITPADGDIGDARDTAIEFRSTIAAAVICDTSASTIILPPTSSDAPTFTSIGQTPEAGDLAWTLTSTDSSESWTAAHITSVWNTSAGQCAPAGPMLDASLRAKPRIALTLSPSAHPSPGIPVRITRPVRYSLYRASDGSWYLGQREWNNTGAYLNTIQPVAGPFLPPGQLGLRVTYFDAVGKPIPAPVADPRTIAAIRLDIRGQTRNARRTLGAAGDKSRHTDSATAVISLRNR